MEMFDTEIKTLIEANGTLEQKEWVAEGPLQEMEAAVTEMQNSWKAFCDVNKGTIAEYGYQWWKCLSYLSLAEDRLKQAFLGRDRSPKSVAQYHRWRMTIIYNRPYRANA
jgi:hypothetical protein